MAAAKATRFEETLACTGVLLPLSPERINPPPFVKEERAAQRATGPSQRLDEVVIENVNQGTWT